MENVTTASEDVVNGEKETMSKDVMISNDVMSADVVMSYDVMSEDATISDVVMSTPRIKAHD